MEALTQHETLLKENAQLLAQVEEYKNLIEAIKAGEVDALVFYKDGKPDVFALESTDFVYRVLVENFAEGALNVSDKGMIVYANPAFEHLTGSTHASVIGSDLKTFIDEKDKWLFERLFKNALSGKSKGEITLVINNKKIPVSISLSSLLPRFDGIGIIITDLTDKKNQEQVILKYKDKLSKKEAELLQAEIAQRSTEKFRVMADILPQKVWTANAKGEIDYFNKKWLDYTNLSFEELKGWEWKKIIHPDDWSNVEKAWLHAIATGTSFEFELRLLKFDGSYRWYLSRGIPEKDAQGNIIMWVCTNTDVDDQKHFANQLERKIFERTFFIQQVLDSSVELITTFDRELRYINANKTALDYMHVELNAIVGKHIIEIFPNVKEETEYEYMQRALKGESLYQANVSRNGLVFETYFKPLIVDTVITGVLVMSKNITQITHSKKRLEEVNQQLEQKNIELMQSNTELASFTFIASHDLQEPLRKIKVFSGLILDKQGKEFSAATLEHFNRIVLATQRMQSLIDALLSYFTASDLQPQMVETDINTLLEKAKVELSEQINIHKAVITSKNLPVLKVIPVQIQQVLSILISNAIKFKKKDIVPHIQVTGEMISETDAQYEVALPRSKYWKISVTDNGVGFDQAYEYKIFELFQKLHTQEIYPGTGIGLSICQKILQSHNGLIKAKGVPGKGSTFSFYLPAI